MPPLSNKAPLGGTTGGNDLHRSGTLRVAVLIDLEWRAVAGGPRILRAQEVGAALARRLRRAMEQRTERHLQHSSHILASGSRLRALGRSMPEVHVSQLRRGLDAQIFATQARTGRSRA